MSTLTTIILIFSVLLLFSFLIAWYEVDKETKKTKKEIHENSQMFVNQEGTLYMVVNDKYIIYPLEKKSFKYLW